jgi:phage baseplate assembly protein W
MPQPTRKYKDLNLNLLVHPNTQDLVYLKDDDAVKRSVRNIVLTSAYERHFDTRFGCEVKGLLFENISPFTSISLQSSIESALKNFEPRINLESVIVTPEIDNNGYSITIIFYINNQINPVKIDFFLERVR